MDKRKTTKPARRDPVIMIGIPAGDQVATYFCQSLVGLTVAQGTLFHFSVGSLVYDARNQITLSAIQQKCDLLLWTDSDMVFEPDALQRLMQTMAETGADLVSGLYVTRKTPIEPVILSRLDTEEKENGMIAINREVYTDYPRDSVFEIAGCGFGFCLTKTDILRKVWEEMGQPFAPLPAMGEDLSACFRMQKLGGKLVCDSRVKCRHMGHFPVGEEDLPEGET